MMSAEPSGTPTPAVLVMPVYNEVRTIAGVLDDVRSLFAGTIIVVDDGSDDGTAQLLEGRSDVIVLEHGDNRGYGASLLSGFAAALARGAGTVVTMDCDGQHRPAHIAELVAGLQDADIVSGSRYLPGSAPMGQTPSDRQGVNRSVTELIDAATGWRLTDAFCGFKAYRASALRLMHLSEPGYAMPLELWAQAWHAGLRVREIAVERIYSDEARSFGEGLDDPQSRLAYYRAVWDRAIALQHAE